MYYGHSLNFFGYMTMFLFWILIIVGITYLIRAGNKNESTDDSALQTLRERYAKGEIEQEEFEARKQVLVLK